MTPQLLIGRERELEQLTAALEAVAQGAWRTVLVTGSAGAGKSALVRALGPQAQRLGARFVAGKFDQYAEQESLGLVRALGALGRQLLAESPEEQANLRARLWRGLNAQAAHARVVPELAALLGDDSELRPVDPAHAAARLVEVVAGILRSVASPSRPLVFVLDDLQWSGSLAARLIEAMLSGAECPGLLLVAGLRDDSLAPEHSLLVALSRWSAAAGAPVRLRVGHLAPAAVSRLLCGTFGLPAGLGDALSDLLAPHVHGNAYGSLETVRGLIEEGLLSHVADAWKMDLPSVQSYLRERSVPQVLARRIACLPTGSRSLLRAMACIGTEVPADAARAVFEGSGESFEAAALLLEERRFVERRQEPGDTLAFHHDLVQEAAMDSIPAGERAGAHRALARCFAGEDRFADLAAEQYAAAAGQVVDAGECVRAALLLRNRAAQARLAGSHGAAHRLLRAATALHGRAAATDDAAVSRAARLACDIDYHWALYSVGQLEDADEVYARIEAHAAGPLERIDAAWAQIGSLSNRRRVREALDLGRRTLHELGVASWDAKDVEGDLATHFDHFRRWVEAFDPAQESMRPEPTQPVALAAAKLLSVLQVPAFYSDIKLAALLMFRCQRLWETEGPCAALLVGMGHANSVFTVLAGDRRTGYLALRHLLDFCDMRCWEPETSYLRYSQAASGLHWYEPLERKLREAERAREGLVLAGDLRYACFSYRVCIVSQLECSPSLHRLAEEVDAALALAHRAQSRQVTAFCLPDRQLLRALRGRTASPGGFDDGDFSEERYLDCVKDSVRAGNYAVLRAIACAIFTDREGLVRHTRHSAGLLRALQAHYLAVWSNWLGGLGAAWQLQAGFTSAHDEPRGAAHALGESIEWLRQRRIDAPWNFRHMHLHLCAERAWAGGDHQEAARLYDEALDAADEARRPWHQALITERAARHWLAQGCETTGRKLLREAQGLYGAWGACAKARQLAGETGVDEPEIVIPARSAPARHRLDMRAVVRTSQALSEERSCAALETRAVELIGALAGATRVSLLQCDAQAAGSMPLAGAAIRDVLRTRDALLIDDAIIDDRFAREPEFQGMRCCSLMVVPVMHLGTMQAILALENCDRAGAFTTATLDAVRAVCGQLSVSLENARLYDRLEARLRDRAGRLQEVRSLLLDAARRGGMAEIAANVLHDVGNVLNSVNVATHVLTGQVMESRGARVGDVAALLERHEGGLGRFLAQDERGRMLPQYVRALADSLAGEKQGLLAELDRLAASVAHIRNVVAAQQSHAGASGMLEQALVADLVDDALRIQQDAIVQRRVSVTKRYEALEPLLVDKTRMLQILVNLIENAAQAMEEVEGERRLSVAVVRDNDSVKVSLRDCGCGIAQEHLASVFSHGFTTKPLGHGFGLHASALAAREMNCSLVARSDGPGRGATFTLEIPIR